MEELNSGPPKTNPSSGREEDLNPGPPHYKSSALTTGPRCLRWWPLSEGLKLNVDYLKPTMKKLVFPLCPLNQCYHTLYYLDELDKVDDDSDDEVTELDENEVVGTDDVVEIDVDGE